MLPQDVTQHYLVRIFSSDRTTLYATLFTINAERRQSTDHTTFIFAERGSAQPQAIVTWFYPGETTGHRIPVPEAGGEGTCERQAGHRHGRETNLSGYVRHQLVGGEIQAPPAEQAQTVSKHGDRF